MTTAVKPTSSSTPIEVVRARAIKYAPVASSPIVLAIKAKYKNATIFCPIEAVVSIKVFLASCDMGPDYLKRD
jgi:hypothetical protein